MSGDSGDSTRQARGAAEGASPLDGGAPWHVLRERITRADRPYGYQLWTALPARYEQYPQAAYPLLLCLDAQWTFGTTGDAVRILASNGQLPRCIVAGLSFDTDHAREVAQLRARDFTLTQAHAPPATGVRLPPHELGGASAFAEFLLSQVCARLLERYRISEQVFVGHSFSALLGLELLRAHNGHFSRYLLASPSVWWDEQCMFERYTSARRQRDCLPGRVFISTGGLERGALAHHGEFARHLAALDFAGLDLEFQVLDNETHLSTVGAAIWRGLRWLFQPDIEAAQRAG